MWWCSGGACGSDVSSDSRSMRVVVVLVDEQR